mmetsp:Transcript_23781/g.67240  ORF Transcript_23781/g.67240 Transcript_23781/m.67240 type:complete len:194 (+) Transcript_23781:226-807(+)|eukprot:CAMPEP_0119562692 /NCGR_PEP_ID=MMETSP1352-20130426/21217_1 /TAXON_ID=265584 /ORGANISM="Stauroneis constricta, Strain CCMP1120" /LENGTH=193 /DNA_ID=CAMNT_0007611141 /DNA_START=209 /DNA_END=790 /DNA_ORIENTATION=-
MSPAPQEDGRIVFDHDGDDDDAVSEVMVSLAGGDDDGNAPYQAPSMLDMLYSDSMHNNNTNTNDHDHNNSSRIQIENLDLLLSSSSSFDDDASPIKGDMMIDTASESSSSSSESLYTDNDSYAADSFQFIKCQRTRYRQAPKNNTTDMDSIQLLHTKNNTTTISSKKLVSHSTTTTPMILQQQQPKQISNSAA